MPPAIAGAALAAPPAAFPRPEARPASEAMARRSSRPSSGIWASREVLVTRPIPEAAEMPRVQKSPP